MNCLIAIIMMCAVAPGDLPTAFDPWAQSATYEMIYRAEVGSLLDGTGKVRLWIPLPAETPHQRVLSERIVSPWPYSIGRDEFGNRMLYVEPIELVELVDAIPNPDLNAAIEIHITVERQPANVIAQSGDRSNSRHDIRDDPMRFLGANRKIPLNGIVKQLATRVVAGHRSSSARIQAFYDYVVRNMKYNKTGRGWGMGDAVRACRVRDGNCTDFHSLYIGMARSYGIAARFVIGFPIDSSKIQGEVKGYHCWAQAFDPAQGWVPIDASEAHKSRRGRDYFGKLPSDRVAFTMGRDLTLNPPQSGQPLNYFVYPYAEVNGHAMPEVPWTLHYRRQ